MTKMTKFCHLTLLFWALSLLASCQTLFYQPTKFMYVPPKKLGLEKKDHFFKASDGTKLHGWEFEAKKKDPDLYVLFFHGNAQNLTAHYLNLHWLPSAGGSFFIMDYRNYGLSESIKANPQGTHKDALAALNYGYKLFKKSGAKKLVVYGQSLSGAILMRALEDFEKRESLDLVVLDSTYPSYQRIAREKTASAWILWPFWPFTPLLFSDRFAAREFYSANQRPTLVIHGEHDRVVPHHWGEEIFKRLDTSKKWFWSIEGGRHGDVFLNKEHGEKYREKFLDLVKSF